ncbi:MAG: ClpXP protease specificity-enhancing factor SspB [Holosporaceae bacterium]|nr:ClpXP protease specificity-enhancing factor SspB [Holosporaceae bacterium]
MATFRYDELVQRALISVVKEVLTAVSIDGLPGNHHFYIRFRTDHPKVKIPAFLKDRHPEEVMIVIQYQFWDLSISDEGFGIDLSFNGVRERLEVSFSALTAFVDPSVKFALQFIPSFAEEPTPKSAEPSGKGISKNNEAKDGKIISFDSFRKK